MQRSWEAVVLKAMRGKDFTLTVRGSEAVTEHYHRVHLEDGGLLAACGVHPTMWVRAWFQRDGRPHQRAYTLVDPDPVAGRFAFEVAVHDGTAARWALAAGPGDTLDVTVQGSRFDLPDPAPRHLHVVGDPASLPAVNSLLTALPATPATVWLEHVHDDDTTLPVRAGAGQTVHWVPRRDGGAHLLQTVTQALTTGVRDGSVDPARDYFWVATEAATTRGLAKALRRDLGADKRRVDALGYWQAG
ncbi:siderophore-interacting protein [Thalassiella azotivora]